MFKKLCKLQGYVLLLGVFQTTLRSTYSIENCIIYDGETFRLQNEMAIL